MNEKRKVAKDAEVKCCEALVRYKRKWDSNSQSVPPPLCIPRAWISEKTGGFTLPPCYNSSDALAKGISGVVVEAVREYTIGKSIGEGRADFFTPPNLGSCPQRTEQEVKTPTIELPDFVHMARIMYLLNLLFQVETADEKGNMKVGLFSRSFPRHREEGVKAMKPDNEEFQRLMSKRPSAEEVLDALKREAEAFGLNRA